jgi:hypothetical protein
MKSHDENQSEEELLLSSVTTLEDNQLAFKDSQGKQP